MVDCSAAPQLKFFVNRVCVLTCPFPSGIVVYPAFCVFTGELLLAEAVNDSVSLCQCLSLLLMATVTNDAMQYSLCNPDQELLHQFH
eukprot:g16723.t1